MKDQAINTDANQLSISVIIPVYNYSPFLEKVVESFTNQNFPKDKTEIIIIDLVSAKTARWAEAAFFKKPESAITYVHCDNTGEEQYRNRGAMIAKNEILFFAYDNIIADNNLLAEICASFIFNEKIQAVFGKIIPMWIATPPRWITNICNWNLLRQLNPPDIFVISKKINFIYGNCFAIRKTAYSTRNNTVPDAHKTNTRQNLNINTGRRDNLFCYNSKAILHYGIRFKKFRLAPRAPNSEEPPSDNRNTNLKKTGLSLTALSIILCRTVFVLLPLVHFVNISNLLRFKNISVSRFFVSTTFFDKRIKFNHKNFVLK